MEFCILGPLEVSDDGRRVSLAATKQRTLLTILLLHANRVVPSDRLVDDLWGARPPPTAVSALQVYVSQLRKALEPGRRKGEPSSFLMTRPGGYLLRVEPGRLDAERFEHLFAEGSRAQKAADPAAAAPLLHEALGLWRGSALAEFSYEPFAQSEIARLEELRLDAVEERIEADLALGRHAALPGELEALVSEHPLRERLRGQLMVALYRAGRQAEALEAYRGARRTFDEELGIVPGPELQRLEAAILRQDPTLDPPTGEPAPPVPMTMEVAREARETRKPVTVLVTARPMPAGIDPEALRRSEESDLEAARRAIERYGGSIESVAGERMTAVFGVPVAHEDDPLRAVLAAVELAGRQAGVATGEAVTGESGSGARVLAGEPVSRAGRLAEAATVGDVLIADGTRRLLGDAARTEPAGGGGGGEAWRVMELVPRPPPLSRAAAGGLVGRHGELAELRGALDRVQDERTAHLFTVLGAAGIGKTRLAEEFASREAQRATVLAGRCVPYGEGITFWPLREIVGRLTATTPLARLLAARDDGELVAERITEATGQTAASSSVEELFWSFRVLFETIGADRSLVLLFEDLHWAEPTLLDLVEYLAERVQGSRLLLLCLARPELLEVRSAWGGGKRNASSVLLEPLSESESEQLIEARAAGLPPETRARVRETAQGNPLFLEQIVAMLAEGAALPGEVPMPPTIQAVLAARLDRLGPGERAVIERAAIVGKEFWVDAVVDQLPDDARRFTSRHLETLADRDLLDPAVSHLPDQVAFRFRHVLIQQATYRGISKQLRAELHERVTAWLERTVGRESPEYAETAGYHLEQAFRYRAELGPVGEAELELARWAADNLASAGQRAFQRGDMPATANLLGRAAALPTPAEEISVAVLADLGYALFEIGKADEASAVLARARARARAVGNRRLEWHVAVTRARIEMYRDPRGTNLDAFAREAETAIDVLGEVGDDIGLARAWMVLSDLLWCEGRLTETSDAATRAADHARRSGSRREVGWALGQIALCALHGPLPVAEGLSRLEHLLRAEPENRTLDANLSGFVAMLEAMAGRIDEARRHLKESRELARELGLAWQASVQELLSGYVELLAGDPVAAERDIRAAQQAFREIGEGWFLSDATVDLPRAIYEQGRYDDALASLDAIDEASAPAERLWQIKRTGVPARLLARRGRVEEGEALVREGIALAADSEFVGLHADVLLDAAEVLLLAGRPEAARTAAAEAVSLYERKGNVVLAARARNQVAELEGARGSSLRR